MAVRWHSVVVDCFDPASLSRWWAEVLDWTIVHESEDEVFLVPHALDRSPTMPHHPVAGPGLLFGRSTDEKTVKNRLHLDLAPGMAPGIVSGMAPGSRDAEVERLIGLGATRVDIGQKDVPWVVLADPEGNEFCVLGDRP
ncbi:VOC family protein [Occultella glacieicola]|uniref:VOC family protein n=1 Tax=Occultella glacieicola TaxID=2518684 RepID=A0ABY2EAH0_9MICO|nr:VOC family protein [Occultella glacieicola]TDE99069.1 VOC family protein [Occultella glacieicola]